VKRLLTIAVLISAVLSVSVITQNPPTTYVQAQEPSSSTPITRVEEESLKEVKEVVVRRGDTLSKIAKRHETTYQRLFDANEHIKDPDVINIGDKIRIPSLNEKLKKRVLFSAAPVVTRSNRYSHQRQASVTQVVPWSGGSGVWDRLAACESGGNWNINTGNGYYGGLQFSLSTWRGVGGSGYPHQASRSEQIKRGKILQVRSGWGQWPACSAKLGLR
jgi:LysM repeat protein